MHTKINGLNKIRKETIKKYDLIDRWNCAWKMCM